ncbi:MAG: patatin-like phospholipase family protein [Candidatus Coatesbacteria bacterium]|nr:MAG: patatin-like phospholipase family protein [Candidatus Coatesbacteria bacterium]
MEPFRQNVALAIDGGGIRGTMVAKALAVVEENVGKQCNEIFHLLAGTSTGSILSATIAAGLSAAEIHGLYEDQGPNIFKKSWRCLFPFKYLVHYIYPSDYFQAVLQEHLGEMTMGDLWAAEPQLDVVITARDLVLNKTIFIKPWKDDFKDWKLWRAVLCSSSAPTQMPVVEGRYVDGGVGSYANPCYMAAYEAKFCLEWPLEETTLISLGTGRYPGGLEPYQADHFNAFDWVFPVIDTFSSDACVQQVRLVKTVFPELDFRRFEMDLPYPIPMDDTSSIAALTDLGEELGHKILNDLVDEEVYADAGTPP